MRNRNSVQWQKVLKDYAVPLVGVLLIMILVGSYFFWDSSEDVDLEKENQIGLLITLDTPESEVYVTYPGNEDKKKVEWSVSLYKWEKIDVKSWNISLSAQWIGEFRLGRWGELKFEEDGNFKLYSSDLWVKNSAPITVNMKYAKVNVGESSVLNLTQNEANSTIYHLSWFVEVTNLAGKNTVLWKWQKVTISSADSTKTDLDLTLSKEDIDDYFKISDWFLKNNGESYLTQQTPDTASWATATWTTSTGAKDAGAPVMFINFQDEQTFKESPISIWGKINDVKVAFVSMWSQRVPVRETDQGFEIKGIILDQKINDLVFKTYDGSGNILSKYAYTAYYEWANVTPTTPKGLFEVKNFSLDASKFSFINPKQNPLTTTERILTIEWMVPGNTVDKIDVNWFVLTKFPSGGTYWKYHVNADYGNLKEGLNVYEVKYIAKDGSVLHKNAFTIVKKSEEKVVSDEASTATWASQ